jgi:hypothetical protein
MSYFDDLKAGLRPFSKGVIPHFMEIQHDNSCPPFQNLQVILQNDQKHCGPYIIFLLLGELHSQIRSLRNLCACLRSSSALHDVPSKEFRDCFHDVQPRSSRRIQISLLLVFYFFLKQFNYYLPQNFMRFAPCLQATIWKYSQTKLLCVNYIVCPLDASDIDWNPPAYAQPSVKNHRRGFVQLFEILWWTARMLSLSFVASLQQLA